MRALNYKKNYFFFQMSNTNNIVSNTTINHNILHLIKETIN